MKLPEHERQAHREAFAAMSLPQKAGYVFAYYKLPLVLAALVIVALGSVLNYRLNHKEPVLYVGLTNVAVTEETEAQLGAGFLDALGANPRKSEVYLYSDLYLVDPEDSMDHQYSYASRLKVMASTTAQELDVVLMSKQAYDLLSHSGYLLDLGTVASQLPAGATDLVQSNDVIVRDNEVEYELGEAEEYEADTILVDNALDLSGTTAFNGLSDTVYLGIIGNTPRLDTALELVAYLLET